MVLLKSTLPVCVFSLSPKKNRGKTAARTTRSCRACPPSAVLPTPLPLFLLSFSIFSVHVASRCWIYPASSNGRRSGGVGNSVFQREYELHYAFLPRSALCFCLFLFVSVSAGRLFEISTAVMAHFAFFLSSAKAPTVGLYSFLVFVVPDMLCDELCYSCFWAVSSFFLPVSFWGA